MSRHASTQPTEVELQFLRILWELGPSTVRVVHDKLDEDESRDTGYATTVKMLSVMFDKELVKRDDSIRPLKYRAAITQKSAQRRMSDDLIQKVYDGSAKRLVMQVLSTKRASQEDLDEIRLLIEKLEEGQS
jgi:BlaI family penicillinase repressor